MTIGQRIKQRRISLGITVDELAAKIGKNRATIYRYESDEIEKFPLNILEPLANALHTTPAYLMGWEEDNGSYNRFQAPNITEEFTTFPIIGEIAAGYDDICIEDWSGETVEIPNSYLRGRKAKDFFVLSVKGDSMFPTYHNGDKVLILKQTTLNFSGQVGAVMYDNEYATLKRVEFVAGEDWLNLVPINPSFPPVRIENEALEHCRVLGIPKLLIREIE